MADSLTMPGHRTDRRPRTLVLATLATLAALASAGAAPAGWYDASWPYRARLTVEGGLVPAAQAPVLVTWTAHAELAAAAQASGNDIVFTAADGTTRLDHEIESYDSATGALVAWVRIPALASGTHATLYMYYGNPGSADQQNVPGVWDGNDVSVRDFSVSFADSSGTNPDTIDAATTAADGLRPFHGIIDEPRISKAVPSTSSIRTEHDNQATQGVGSGGFVPALGAQDLLPPMRVLSGTYTGDGLDNRPVFVGFPPDVVILDRDDPGTPATDFEAVIRTSTMPGDSSKGIDDSVTFGSALAPNLIQSLGPMGFTIGDDAKVNQNGIEYHWIAFQAEPGQLELGTYPGTGVAQDITSVSFAPAYVLAMSAGPRNVVQRSSSMPASFSQDFIAVGYTDAILNRPGNGFRVGTNPIANEVSATFHYVAWAAVPGKVAVSSLTGNNSDNRDVTPTGFWPEWVVVSRSSGTAGSQVSAPVHKPASTGVAVDSSLLFSSTDAENDDIQELQPNGFQLGKRVSVNDNDAPNTYYWVAFGPHQAQTHLRSIGTAADYGAGTVGVTVNSTTVSGTGTAWLTAKRGRGDVLTVPCTDPPTCTNGVHYTVAGVSGEGALEITPGYAGATNAAATYLLRRQHTTLAEWESCIDGGPCGFFPDPSNNLVDDDRIEVGIAYKDSVFALGGADVTIDGMTTDATRTITLTADPGNRHHGVTGAGVVLDNGRLLVKEDYVTVEWLEIRGGTKELIETDTQNALNQLVLRFLLLHDTTKLGIRIRDPNTTANIYDNIVYQTLGGGIALDPNSMAGPVRILNNTVFACAPGAGISSGAATNPSVTLSNNIAHSNSGDIAVPTPNAASSHNLSGDGTAFAASPGGSDRINVNLTCPPGPPCVSFVSTSPGLENLHLQGNSDAIDQGADLSTFFGIDIDEGARTGAWDIGADEVGAGFSADLGITKDDGQATAVPGTAIAYTITVTNNGPDTVTSLFVNDAVPAEITGAVFTPSTGTYNGGTGEWTGLSLAATQSVVLTLSGTIDPAARGSLANTATVSPPAGWTDTNPPNDLATDTDSLSPSADLGLTKLDDLDPVGLGSVLVYTLAVTNGGPSEATGVTVADTLPAEMAFESATPTQGSCGYDAPTRTLTCTLGSILPSSGASVDLEVRPQAVGTFVNTATVLGLEPDPGAGNDTANQATTVQVSSIGVPFFTVTSTSETNVLEWVNPTADYASTEIVFRTDRYPTSAGDGTVLYDAGVAGGQERLPHPTGPGSNGVTYYYAAFVHRTASLPDSPGRFCTGRPFDTTGPVKWALSTGATAISPPTVGAAGVVAPSNDGLLYAMERGSPPPGGEWPAAWWPIELGDVVQSRSPVVPIPVGTPTPANPVVFLGSQDGRVYTVDATQGGKAGFPWGPTSVGPMVQAAPAGIFSAFGGGFDYLLVGTRDAVGPNALVALDPFTGLEVGRFDNGGAGPGAIGIINGMATVDYATKRVYFTSHAGGSATTLWCRQLVASPTVFAGCGWLTPRELGDIDSSPVLRGGRIYVGSSAGGGTVYSIDAASGDPALDRTFPHGDGQVKGFVFPDRGSNDIYFATSNFVWGVEDLAGGMSDKFGSALSLGAGVTPSAVLFTPGSHYLYVGGSDGSLYQFDVLGGPLESVPLGDGQAVVGAPSLDSGFALVHVGSEAGIFYAVAAPIAPTGTTCVQDEACSSLNVGQACYHSTPATECLASTCTGPGACSP